MGRKTSYLRSPDRWDGGRLQTPAVPCCDRTDTQRKEINLSPSRQVRSSARKKRNGKSICPLGGWWARWSRFSFWSQVKCSAADYGELTAQLPDETLVRGNLLLHPDSAKMGHNREMLDAFSQLRSEPKHKHMSLMATHRLKCSMIFSSRTFSGKFPTHKCLVSRTILCAPAPLSCRWVFSVRFSPCKMKRGCKFYAGQEKGQKSSAQIIEWSWWPSVNH